MTFIKTRINPWSCMPAIAMIESIKNVVGNAPVAEYATTVNGFQPQLGNVLTLDEPMLSPLQDEIHNMLDDLQIEGAISRSWFVSYDQEGYQLPHSHFKENEKYSAVVCLLGGRGGELCFEDRSFSLSQGDVLLFDPKEEHWTTKCYSPKIVLAFDITGP